MKQPGTWGLDLTLYEGARYSDVKKKTFAIHQLSPQTMADVLRSLAREVERDAGLRPPTLSVASVLETGNEDSQLSSRTGVVRKGLVSQVLREGPESQEP